MDLEQFILNRNAFPPEELARLIGKHVAWSPDGLRILAFDDDPLKEVILLPNHSFAGSRI
ncbi:MAG: hypothetical protein ACHRXM_12140 [Isosphaerales bacterium]